ncbi:hypothetical protein T03_5848 [Trichinella britovi]|uniref:Uncharacterized protein n=2 Tax=Trichinella TaxID=6333 RepID=A0A0V1C4C7_TRIBR|nr:hypothetical protein T05_12217 [Trichinella murrelli]KRY43932.1 hypothetical protein T03_9491 [Trichinella britovi]KRY43988.1 hypothetical protein T03_16147 [Trichinella britovi]KRY43998.1 hypothetical protein T03_3553 [Trichinella britovi]KRY44187.1 hypothetical protein T03_2964 [Trichinella britovi]
MVYKVLQHRNNAMRLNISTTKASYSSVKLHVEKKMGKQLMRLMLLHCAQTIITRSCPYSSRFSSLTQSTEPAQNEALLQ